MDLTTVRDMVSVALGTLTIASMVFTWIIARSRASAAEIAKLNDRLTDGLKNISNRNDAVENRLTRIESEMHHMPDNATINSVLLKMNTLQGEMGVLTERLRPIQSVTDRLQEFLLSQAK